MNRFTDHCVSLLAESLRSKCPSLDWCLEKTLYSDDLTARVDICGMDDKMVVLVQFEMHRQSLSTNMLKVAYCLESDRSFLKKRILMLHVLCPFHRGSENSSNGQEQNSVPEWAEAKVYGVFSKSQRRKKRREPAQRDAHNHRLLCLFLKRKGVLNDSSRSYEIIDWDLSSFPDVHEATIVLPKEEEPFPEGTGEAIMTLGKRLLEVIEEWQGTLNKGNQPTG